MRKKSKKFDYVKVRQFFIKVRKKIIYYKLELSKNINIYLVFYILLLELVNYKRYI